MEDRNDDIIMIMNGYERYTFLWTLRAHHTKY